MPWKYSYDSAIIIAGTTRSGTTWLAETLSAFDRCGYLEEPLHVSRSEIRRLGFSWRQYIPENAVWPEAERYFAKLLRGQFLTQGLVPRQDVRAVAKAQWWAIKFCRANRLLPWLVRTFPVRRPILLVRHPCAVVSSQLRHPLWSHVPAKFTVDGGRYSSYLEPFREVLESLKTREEVLAATWALDYLIPFQHRWHNSKWLTVFYEDLLRDGIQELNRIVDLLGFQWDGEVERVFRRPSSTTVYDSAIVTGEQQLTIWRRRLKAGQAERIFNTVARLGMGGIYGKQFVPVQRSLAAGSGAGRDAETA